MKRFWTRRDRLPRYALKPGQPIGLPRGMMYYHFAPLWQAFWENLGWPVLVSPTTNPDLLEAGKSLTRSDLCLPIKTLLGHILWLKDRVGALFLPRLISIEEEAYLCPKILGINDMVRNLIPDLPPLIDPMVNYKGPARFSLADSFLNLAAGLSLEVSRVQAAYQEALACWNDFQKRLPGQRGLPKELIPEEMAGYLFPAEGRECRYRIGVIGRPYLLFDPVLSHHLLKKLSSRSSEVYCYQALPPQELDAYSNRLPKKVYWSLGKELVGASLSFGQQSRIDGIINVSSFACGQDAFTSYLIEHYLQTDSRKPFLSLVLDEHSSEVGLTTRLEAFYDVLEARPSAG